MEYVEHATIKLETTDCCACGVIFAIPKRIMEQRRRTGDEFFCPNGHPLIFGETKYDRLQKKLAATKEQLRREEIARENVENSLRTTKGVVTKLKKRIGNGVCPCCHRHFTNLQRHMNSKHPDFNE